MKFKEGDHVRIVSPDPRFTGDPPEVFLGREGRVIMTKEDYVVIRLIVDQNHPYNSNGSLTSSEFELELVDES
jgi:ribosomal protein L21E